MKSTSSYRQPLKSCMVPGAKPSLALRGRVMCLFIPAGWLCVERVLRGMLVYGTRQAVLLKGLVAAANYEELMGCYVASSKDGVAPPKMAEASNYINGEVE